MFPFDVILFDVGGVLLTNGWDHRERAAVVDQFHLDRRRLKRTTRRRTMRGSGATITLDEYLDAAVFYEPRSFHARGILRGHLRAVEDFAGRGAWASLRELAASDRCMLGALNNEARETE